MTTLFGRFEIQSELSKSETALIYKAMDLKANQVVALKTQSLEPLGERLDAFVDTLLAEGESTRDLVSQNIVALYGAGEVDGSSARRWSISKATASPPCWSATKVSPSGICSTSRARFAPDWNTPPRKV